MRNAFITCLQEQARFDERIFLVTPDLGFSVLENFAQAFPDRFLNVGIAEQNAIGVAAGLALSGKIVYVYSIIPFVTMRCFEQIRNDIAYMNLPVRLVGVGAGLSYGSAGATHHAIEDIAIMRALPNMLVCCPGDLIEVREIMNSSIKQQGPMYIRLGKNGEKKIHDEATSIAIGQAVAVTAGADFAIITTSNLLALGRKVVGEWAKAGKMGSLISMPTVKPLDAACIMQLLQQNIPILTLEEHSIIGGLGSAVAEVIAESGYSAKFQRVGVNDIYSHKVGGHQYLRSSMGITEESINQIIGRWL